MIKISNKKIQKIFGKAVIPNIKVLGVDGASRSGWCKIKTDKTNCYLDYGFIDVKSSDKIFKYNQIINLFQDIVKDNDVAIIEEAYYKRNLKVFQMLSRISAIVYTLSHLAGINCKMFVLATTARNYLGLQGKAEQGKTKKEVIQKEFLEKTKIKVTDNDVVDAIILALNGTLKENTLEI